MFRTLAGLFTSVGAYPPPAEAGPDTLFATHPIQLSRWLEEIWTNGGIANWPSAPLPPRSVPLGDADIVRRLELPNGLRDDTLQSGLTPFTAALNAGDPAIFTRSPRANAGVAPLSTLPWDHLIYAYLVESTGIVEILGEVVRRYARR